MNITTTGSGSPAVVVVPGGPGLPVTFYREFTDLLAETGRVVTYEMAGVWPDAPDAFPTTVAGMAAELEEAVGQVRGADGNRPVVLLGHSFGVAVVIEALARGLEADAAVFVSGFPSGEVIARGIASRARALPEAFHDAYATIDTTDPEAVMALLLEYWIPRHFCTAPLPASMSEGLGRMNGAYSTHYLGPNLFEPSGEVMRWDRSDALASLELPVQLLFGAQDYLTPEDMEAMADAIPNARLAVSEKASHSVWIEDPAFVRSVLEGFFARNRLR